MAELPTPPHPSPSPPQARFGTSTHHHQTQPVGIKLRDLSAPPVSPCPRIPVLAVTFLVVPALPPHLPITAGSGPRCLPSCRTFRRNVNERKRTYTYRPSSCYSSPAHAPDRMRVPVSGHASGGLGLRPRSYAPPGRNAVVHVRYCLAARPELHLAQDRSLDLQARLSSKVEVCACGGRLSFSVSTRTSGRGQGGASALWYRYPQQQRCGTGTGTAVRLLRIRLLRVLTECWGLTASRTGRVHLYASDDGGDPVSAYGAVRTGYQHQCLRVSTNNEKREKSVLTVSRPGTIHCDSNLGTWRAITCP